MDPSQLPDVDDLLVTADHPALSSNSGMDHARCAALHNYLVRYAWLAEGRSPASIQASSANNFFSTHGDAAEALRPRLDPSVAAFLDAAIVPSPAGGGDSGDDPSPAPFFWWVSELSEPDSLFADETADLYDQPAESLVCLYFPNIGQGGEFGGGLFYHQGHHRAAVFMHMDDQDFALPVEAHPELWHPLETVLSNWIELIRLGKVATSPRGAPALFGSEKIGPWEWRPYGDAQVVACVDAWHRLCDAVEGRMSSPLPPARTAADAAFEPLLPPAALDAASVPQNCFARDFLSRARRPRFQRVAPGLLLPPSGPDEFAQAQPYSRLPRVGPQVIAPTLLFFPERREASLAPSPFRNRFGAPSRVLAGVYSESVERGACDNAEEGFRLLLPYGLEGDVGQGGAAGARKSDGSFLDSGTAVDLFQHGYKPFGGDYYRPQRLERLLDQWHRLVDQEAWPVGPEGVMGTIDEFKKADTTRWRDYCIPPTW